MGDSMSPNINVQTRLLWAVVLTIIHDLQTVGRNNGGGWMGFPPDMFFASFIMIVLGVILDEVVLVPREATALRRILTVAALATLLQKMRSEILLEIMAF
jgi:hypothetical protein